MSVGSHERIKMTLIERMRFEADDLLYGPGIEDRIHAIEPDAGLRVLKQAACQHEDFDWMWNLCLFCGMTRCQIIEEKRG